MSWDGYDDALECLGDIMQKKQNSNTLKQLVKKHHIDENNLDYLIEMIGENEDMEKSYSNFIVRELGKIVNGSQNERLALELVRIARMLLAKNEIKTDFMICGYRQDGDVFRITIAIDNRCFMSNYSYDEIKKSVKEVKSIFAKIERIAAKLHCKKIGYKQTGTMNSGYFESDDENTANDFIGQISKIKPNFIVNKLK